MYRVSSTLITINFRIVRVVASGNDTRFRIIFLKHSKETMGIVDHSRYLTYVFKIVVPSSRIDLLGDYGGVLITTFLAAVRSRRFFRRADIHFYHRHFVRVIVVRSRKVLKVCRISRRKV